MSIIPVIKELKKENDQIRFLITSTTLSSGKILKKNLRMTKKIFIDTFRLIYLFSKKVFKVLAAKLSRFYRFRNLAKFHF